MNDIGTKVRFLGNIPARRHEYWIYFHDHVYFNNYRETRQLIVMGRGCKYAGSYTVPVDPLRIVGNDIIFDASPRDGNVMHFSNRLPPAFAWIDGENPTFVR